MRELEKEKSNGYSLSKRQKHYYIHEERFSKYGQGLKTKESDKSPLYIIMRKLNVFIV